MSNLPPWPGAREVYSRAYRKLEGTAAKGHATPGFAGKRRRIAGGLSAPIGAYSGHVSPEMRDLIDALNRGDEERIKAHLLFDIRHA